MKLLMSLLTVLTILVFLPTAEAQRPAKGNVNKITYELYDAFQKLELDRWDAIIDQNVIIQSPAGHVVGLKILKDWGVAFGSALAYRIDLVDEHLALDGQGNGRGFITFNLHWKHNQEAFGPKPTGREGTSVETMLLTIRNNRISRIGRRGQQPRPGHLPVGAALEQPAQRPAGADRAGGRSQSEAVIEPSELHAWNGTPL